VSLIDTADAYGPFTNEQLVGRAIKGRRDPEGERGDGVLATCRELGIGFVAYSPLGRGFLTGQIKSVEDLAVDDSRRSSPRFQRDNFAKNLTLVEHVTALARQKAVTPGQLALAWVLSRGDDVVAIPGTKRREYLEENVAATAVAFTSEELAQIDAVVPRDAAAGQRYAAAAMRAIDR
jgi:aryl-alcohol dehydrogenase-like predicted oxidoreductase